MPDANGRFRGITVPGDAYERIFGSPPATGFPSQESPSEPRLTRRQKDAVAWLRSVGKATTRTVRRGGFRPSTLDALVDAGLARSERRFRAGRSYCVYFCPSLGKA